MKMILLRHGTRDLTGANDAGLNRQGQAMAQNLVAMLAAQPAATPTVLLSSPKKRAHDTLVPLAEYLELEIVVDAALDERGKAETAAELQKRIRGFFNSLVEQYDPNDVLYVCSHADWLEDATAILPSGSSDHEVSLGFACGESRTFEFDDGTWRRSK